MRKPEVKGPSYGQFSLAVLLMALAATALAATPATMPGGAHGRTTTTQVNKPPIRPDNITPRNGVLIHFANPHEKVLVLRATPFRDPNSRLTPNGRQSAAQWVVTTSSQSGAAIYNSGPTTRSLNMLLLRRELLKSGTTYFWSVRYADASGQADTQWSPWSKPSKFTTAPEVIKDLSPAGLGVGRTRMGQSVYVDRTLPVVVKAPSRLEDQPMILTRSGDAGTSGAGTLISFKSDLPVRVFVAYDDRATTLPQWLWAFKPYVRDVPTTCTNEVKEGKEGKDGIAGKDGKEGKESKVATCPLPPSPPPFAFKLLVSDRVAPARRLLFQDYATTQTVELGQNLPDPAAVAPTTATLRMYSVIVQPKKK